MELILGSETSTHLIQAPGLHPKEYTLHQQHGESLKTRIPHNVYSSPNKTSYWALKLVEKMRKALNPRSYSLIERHHLKKQA
jgi:hypothetical protein